jgi:hypothetical protein
MMVGAGAVFSTVLVAFRYTNGFKGTASAETDEEEVERRENAKKFRRRPISETIEQLGEGRGKQTLDTTGKHLIDRIRHLRPRLRREEATAYHGQLWHRREGCPRDQLDVLCASLAIEKNRLCEAVGRGCQPFQARVYISTKVSNLLFCVFCLALTAPPFLVNLAVYHFDGDTTPAVRIINSGVLNEFRAL